MKNTQNDAGSRQSGDIFTLLTHRATILAKTWNADGSITSYGDAKYFDLEERAVPDFPALCELLDQLARSPQTCVVRGKYVGDDEAKRLDPEFEEGRVRRLRDLFPDRPLHAVMFDVDDFVSLICDPLINPAVVIAEYISTMLPAEFRTAGHYWQLSSSAGAPGSQDKLKAHIWFWLDEPLTGAQLTAWAQEGGIEVDVAPFRPNQVHYTANPIFAEGVVDPVALRSGVTQGARDTVPLVLSETAMAALGSASRNTRVAEMRSTDPIGLFLLAADMVKSKRKDGGLNITCPFEEGHSTDSGETSTIYYPANTGGFAKAAFKCLHGSCEGRKTYQYLAKIGYDSNAQTVAEFAMLAQHTPPGGLTAERHPDGGTTMRQKSVPEAQYLCTQLKNAERLQRHFGTMLLSVADRWYGWDGRRWVQESSMATRAASSLSRIIRGECDALSAQFGDNPASDDRESKARQEMLKALRKWGALSEMTANIEGTLRLFMRLVAVDADRLDSNPWLLNCANGTVDLRTSKLRPHNPLDYITRLAPVAYNPDAKSPMWLDTVTRVTLEYDKDAQPQADFMQRWFGYNATGETREQKFVVHYGNGANGKSTILDTVAAVLGDYAGTAAPGLLMAKGNDRHPTEIADLFGKRAVTASETGENGVLREDFIKQATGGDRMKARFMHADFFEFVPTHKFNIQTNHKPTIKGQDGGIWRRVLLLPYVAKFGTAAEVAAGRANWLRDTRTVEKLKAEREGVLSWVIDGARLWFEGGLQEPASVLEASQAYQSEQDRVGTFVSECCELGSEHEVGLTEGVGGLYPAYNNWCSEGGMRPLSKIRLLQELERVVPGYVKSEKKIAWHGGGRRNIVSISGIRLKNDTHQPREPTVPADFCIQTADRGKSAPPVSPLSS
jgi:putative DNA primase/helicase